MVGEAREEEGDDKVPTPFTDAEMALNLLGSKLRRMLSLIIEDTLAEGEDDEEVVATVVDTALPCRDGNFASSFCDGEASVEAISYDGRVPRDAEWGEERTLLVWLEAVPRFPNDA